MRKLGLLLFIGALALSSCKKDDNNSNSSTTKTLPVYLGNVALNNYFGGVPPMVRITESGTSNQVEVTVNTCGNVNGATCTIKNGKTYNVVFGTYIDGTWAQYGGFNGTMTIASDGQVSGVIGSGVEALGTSKTANYTGCGTTISGDILLFY